MYKKKNEGNCNLQRFSIVGWGEYVQRRERKTKYTVKDIYLAGRQFRQRAPSLELERIRSCSDSSWPKIASRRRSEGMTPTDPSCGGTAWGSSRLVRAARRN